MQPRFYTCIVLFCGVALCSSATEKARSLSQYGITWTFSEAKSVGKFANGDWWVQGPVTISLVTPKPQEASTGYHNGGMVNPKSNKGQTFDSRIAGFKKGRVLQYPLVVQPDSSLVSTISLLPEHANCTVRGRSKEAAYRDVTGVPMRITGRTYLKTAAVLTVLAKPPASLSFRPPYAGDEKPLYELEQVKWDLLPRLKLEGHKSECSRSERVFQRVHLGLNMDWSSRTMHPADNMPNYHASIYGVTDRAAVLTLLDISNQNLVKLFIQHGIDHRAVVTTGHGDSAAHKWPIIFAGIMLGEKKLAETFLTKTKTPIRTDWMTYYAKNATSSIKSQIIPAGQGWTGATTLWRQEAGTQGEFEHLHPSEWGKLEPHIKGGGRKRFSYQNINSANWAGTQIAAKLLKAEKLWNHQPFFDYVDRWMRESYTGDQLAALGTKKAGKRSGQRLISDFWHRYRPAVK